MPPTSTVALPLPTLTVCAEMLPEAVGMRLTVTAIVCVAVDPCPSSAVTVMVAEPPSTAVMVTFEPETEAVALAVSEELAE